MTAEILTVFAILAVAVVLFVTEWLRVDVVALLVLLSVAVSGLLTPVEALAGFSNPAVVTVWAVFVLSGGLARTGVASFVGQQVLRLAGRGEMRLLTVIMLTAGSMSAFMNNVGVAALLLPVVMDISRRTGRAPSRLLMPLAFSSLLGGLTTLIGTPPNILVSEVLASEGRTPFELFDYTPVGAAMLLAGVVYMALVGRHLLPAHDLAEGSSAEGAADPRQHYDLRQRLFVLRIPASSTLAGRSLEESRLGSALGLTVIGILRNGRTRLGPPPGTVLLAGDRLVVEGRLDRLTELSRGDVLALEEGALEVERLVSADIQVAEAQIQEGSPLTGKTLEQVGFRRRYDVIVLAVRRGERTRRTNLETLPLAPGDVLLLQGAQERLDHLQLEPSLRLSRSVATEVYHLEERLMVVRVPQGSSVAGKTLAESHLGDAFGLGVLGIVRGTSTQLMPEPDERLQAGDTLLVKGRREDLLAVQGLQSLEVEAGGAPELVDLESEEVALAEAVLSPRTSLAGQTLRQLHFREKYGLNVLAIFREGKAYRSNLRDMALRFGDALLLHGSRKRLKVLGSEPDFLVLTGEAQEPLRRERAPLAALLMAGVLVPVILGWLPIYIAAIGGATLMVLTRCLTMDEAYHFIEWRAVFLIAGMLPLGFAMERTGAAALVAEGVVGAVGGLGPLAVVAGIYLITAVAAQVMPTSAVAILIAPVALDTAVALGLSPYALAMTVAMSASASFMSPVAHPANVLIMGPGGYRFVDYIRVGLPLTLVCLAVVLLVLPLIWPLAPAG